MKLSILLTLAAAVTACHSATVHHEHARQAEPSPLTLLPDAVAKGAVCLDGTAPGYYWRPGTGTGKNKWIVHQEGGGWCYNEDDCVGRSKTRLGSSKYFPKSMTFGGLLSDDCTANPDFCTYNVVFLPYCDGASFSGNKDTPLEWKGTTLHFRGKRILDSIFAALAEHFSTAEEFILTGCSAGGLATYLHADYPPTKIPSTTKYAAIADAGYFIDALDEDGQQLIRPKYQYVYKMQNASSGVNQDCITKTPEADQWKCFFAQYTMPHIKSRFFALNSQYDTWQLPNILNLHCLPPKCEGKDETAFEGWRATFLAAFQPVINGSSTTGTFADACLTHCQSMSNAWSEYKIGGQLMRETFADWYFQRTTGKGREMDGPYPSNPTCPHHVTELDFATNVV
ncbi:uncharacterized protein LOC135814192 [Sycon ciliatum]|uniref:uncharacterized protein LOC135814192 n=1 Tax=Sycon ciliatum TaxID=27933 RepID=UPI0031F60D9D